MSHEQHPTGRPILIPAGAEDLCLGFANTRYWRGIVEPTESLTSLPDLLRWLEAGSVLPEGLAGPAYEDTDRANALFAEAIALRETIYRIFSTIAEGKPVSEDDFAALNLVLAQSPPRHHMAHSSAGFVWRTAASAPSAAALLAPVVWSAADLLVQSRRRRIRRCANDDCLWLFLDESKSGTRRWCDMAACGNRAKARRHYLKTRPRGQPTALA